MCPFVVFVVLSYWRKRLCRFHLVKEGSYTAKVVCDNIYVDNVYVETNSIEEALHLYEEAKNIFSHAAMNLHNK